MPNTLAHFAPQGLATRLAIPRADAKWILLGCIIPDGPWILRRVVRLVAAGVDLYDLQLYAIVQSSLAFCILLSGALAAVTKRPARIFAILSLNSLLHLLLDASQTKWGNGAHLLAPISWDLLSLDLFWPEGVLTYALTAGGLLFFATQWRASLREPPSLGPCSKRSLVLSIVLSAAYFLLPFPLLGPAELSGSHEVRTLRHAESRVGRTVELDRCPYRETEDGAFLRTYAGEELALTGASLGHDALISVRATFVEPETLRVHEFHEHPRGVRDGASYVGLSLAGVLWGAALWRHRRRRGRATSLR